MDGGVVLRDVNRIFGPDDWSFEVTDAYDYETQDRTDSNGQVFKQRMFYARGSLHIYQDGKHIVTRGDAGANIAESDAPCALEKAAKGAVPNALKRAALTLGPIFGMNLNNKGRGASGSQQRQAQRASGLGQNRQNQERRSSGTNQNRQPSGAQRRQEPQCFKQSANGTGSAGEIPFDPSPIREPASQPANGASLPTNLEHVGALMMWATENYGPMSGGDVVRVARKCGIPELIEVGVVSELHPFRNDERLLSAIANAK